MTVEILEMMTERRKGMRNNIRYNELGHEVKQKCDQEKEEWLNKVKECENLEIIHDIDSKMKHRKVMELSGKEPLS